MSKVLGVDIDYRSIRLALVKNGKIPQLIKAVEIPVPYGSIDDLNRFVNDEADLSIRETIRKNKLHANKVAINLRSGMVREFSFEGIKEKELRNALELELTSTIQDISVSYQLNYKIYNKTKKSVSGLVAFCPHKLIESALSYQDKLPGSIKYLDVHPNAVCKALKHTLKSNKFSGSVMIVDVGYRESIITIIDENRVVISRSVGSGANQLDKLVSEEFSISIEEAETERKNSYKSYFESGIDVERFIRVAYQAIQVDTIQGKIYFEKSKCKLDRVLLIGEGADVPSFDLYMQESFDIPVQTVSAADAKGKFVENYHKLLPAIGSAIREE